MVSNPNSSISREELLDLVYPVGSVYISFNNTSPEDFLGGTWTQLQDRFLLAASDTYPAGFNGGEATHTLTQAEIPNYTIPQTSLTGTMKGGDTRLGPTNSTVSGIVRNDGGRFNYSTAREGGDWNGYGNITINASHSHSSGGGGQAHNNMPPYIGVYMWRRTA